jgi:glycosyltransferase involved in cell wall biosynthesis
VLKEATTLGEAGHCVTVLTVRNHAPSEPQDLVLLAGAPFTREVIEMRPGSGGASFRLRLQQRIARTAVQRFGWQTPHALGPAGALLAGARRHAADLTIVHNEVAHWVGTRLLAAGRHIAADIEDWHSEDLLPQDRAARPLELLRHTERVLLQKARYTTTTSLALAQALHQRHGGNEPTVVTNAFPLPDLPPRPASENSPPRFFWFSQTVGPGRGLEAFLEAWSRTRRTSHLVLLGEVRGGYDAHLLSLLPAALRSRVTFVSLVPPRDLPAVIARHDIGLALEPTEPANKNLTISNKILHYLGAGLAVVATPTAGQREVLAHGPDAGALLEFSDPERAAAALDTLLADRATLHLRQRAARRLAEERYCWEREQPKLRALVERSLRPRTSSA